MSGVVIRCPNCGTTQGALGECEACHEAEMRYFCPNHSPGRWLDGPACSACGASVGVAPAETTPAPRPRRAPGSGGVKRAREDPPERVELDVFAMLEKMGAARPRGARPPDPPAVPLAVASAVGCVRRLVVIAVILFVLAVLAMLAFFGLFGVGGPLNRATAATPAHAPSAAAPRRVAGVLPPTRGRAKWAMTRSATLGGASAVLSIRM